MKKCKCIISFIFLLHLSNPYANDTDLYDLFVLNVVDGDTIKVELENKIKKIRFSAIDTPETRQIHGKKSKKFLYNLINKKKIKFHKLGTDRYGRLLGIIYLNDKDVNLEMVIKGHAWVYRKYLKTIPKGQLKTYSQVAKAIKKPKAVRAVANAIGKNPYAPKIPCHRVIRSDGSLGGYSGKGGINTKRKLLKLEGVLL